MSMVLYQHVRGLSVFENQLTVLKSCRVNRALVTGELSLVLHTLVQMYWHKLWTRLKWISWRRIGSGGWSLSPQRTAALGV